MNTDNLLRRDVLTSFCVQLLLGIHWGLMAVLLTPKALQKYDQDLYYTILPLMGVDRSICKERRTLSERYHKLGLPDFKVHTLSKKVHFLQQK